MAYSPLSSTVHERGGSVLTAVANAMVRVHREQFGRGPTEACATWCSHDVLVVKLEGTLTCAEARLVAIGEQDRVYEARMCLRHASVRAHCEPVERITGRRVRSYVSGLDAEADGVAIETFVLHPQGYDGPSRADGTARAH